MTSYEVKSLPNEFKEKLKLLDDEKLELVYDDGYSCLGITNHRLFQINKNGNLKEIFRHEILKVIHVKRGWFCKDQISCVSNRDFAEETFETYFSKPCAFFVNYLVKNPL